jgi:hypothetical protein
MRRNTLPGKINEKHSRWPLMGGQHAVETHCPSVNCICVEYLAAGIRYDIHASTFGERK